MSLGHSDQSLTTEVQKSKTDNCNWSKKISQLLEAEQLLNFII